MMFFRIAVLFCFVVMMGYYGHILTSDYAAANSFAARRLANAE